MIRVEMLPAEHGDSILLEYGPGSAVKHRVLFDAGPETAYSGIRERLLQLPASGAKRRRKIDLFVVTHIDADHIEGVVKLLQDDEVALSPADVWFNDFNHLALLDDNGVVPDRLGPEQGEFLGALLQEQKRPWNKAFRGRPIVVPPDGEPLPSWKGPGGLVLTVLSPTGKTLIALRRSWRKVIQEAGFQPGDRERALAQFAERRWAKEPSRRLGDENRRSSLDNSVANGSSIAVLAEYGGRSLLLVGDAFADVLRAGIERLAEERGSPGAPFAVDLFKLSHHGSKKNMTPQLMAAVAATTYGVSSNGKRFRHPDREALEIVVAGHTGPSAPNLAFNYRTKFTDVWAGHDRARSWYGDEAVLRLSTD